jgi:hypothetical protein
MGVTKSFAGLVVCRTLLGLFEAGFFPGKMKEEPPLAKNVLTSISLSILDVHVLSTL